LRFSDKKSNTFLNNIVKSFEKTTDSIHTLYQGQDFHEKFPYLKVSLGDIIYGCFDPSGGAVRAPEALKAIQDLAVKYGAKIIDGVDVCDIKSFQNCVKVYGNNGQMYSAKSVVLCPGPWVGKLLDKVGIQLPLQPTNIQPLDSWKSRDFLPHTPDKNPVIDTVPGKENVVIGFGFLGTGFNLGPVAGNMLADMAMGIKTRQEVELLSISRFLGNKSKL